MKLSPPDAQALRRSYLFSGLAETEYQGIVAHATTVDLTAGQLLFSQGDPVDAFYWVSDGLIRLYRSSPKGDEKVIELIQKGRFFAEAALFMGGRFPVNASAQVPSRLIAIDSAHFRAWLGHDVEHCLKLLAGMSMRLHKLVDEIDGLTLLKGADRLLQYLIDHSEPDESGRIVAELEVPKQVIASRIGVKPETFSRLLHKLAQQGVVELSGSRVIIRDTAGVTGLDDGDE